MVADPSPDNADWTVSVPSMKVQMQPPYDPWKELFFVTSPILVFLVGIEMRLLSDIHADSVLNDLVQNTLFDLANHHGLLVHKSDHLLHEIDPDTHHMSTYVMWSEVLVVLNCRWE